MNRIAVTFIILLIYSMPIMPQSGVGGGGQSNVSGGGAGSSAAAIGPIINVTNPANAGCFATVSTGQDWSTCFASVTAAAVAAAKVSVGTPTVRSVVTTPMATSTITSATATVNIQAGDTVLIAISASGAVGLSFTVSDPGGNAYSLLSFPANSNGSFVEQATFYSTGVGAAKAASGTLTVTCTNGANFFGFFVMDTFNVGSIGQKNIANFSVSSTTPANTSPTTTATQDNNNIIASVLTYCGGGATTLSAATGTLQGSWNGTVVICGAGLVTNTASTPSTLTTSATISAAEPWAMNTIELRSVQITIPTIYFPYSAIPYNYSSGLNPSLPVTIKGEPGSTLCYQGVAHAIDLGPSGLTSANFQSTRYTIDGLNFQCGGSMTQGIFINNWLLFVTLSNNQFNNFGNQTAFGVWANGNQNDLYMVSNHFYVNDGAQSASFPGTTGIPRGWVNMTTNSINASTLRFENNFAACVSGVFGNVGCSNTFGTTQPLIQALGITHIILGNNIGGGWCPTIELMNGDTNTKIENNHFESDQSGCFAIAFQTGVFGLNVLNNFYIGPSAGTVPFIGPIAGTDTLINAEVSNNHINRLSAVTPVVLLNNVVGQVGNLAWHNMCGTGTTTLGPCPLLHTTGGNITQWNADYNGSCTLTTGACPAFNFSGTYAAAPKCTASWTGTGTFTGILKVATSTTQLTITDTVSESTGVVNWSCNPDAQ